MSDSWPQVALDEVCERITDGTHHSPTNLPSGEFRYVTAKNIRPWGLDLSDISYVDQTTHREIYSRCPVERGDVLYIKDGVTTGLAVVNPLEEQFSMLSSVALLKPRREVLESSYLKHWLNSPLTVARMTSEMTGTAIKRLVLRQIRAAKIPLPSITQQRLIADKLNVLLAKIDACRGRLDRVPQILKKFREAVLEAAVSGRLTEEWRGDPELTGWATKRAADVCAVVQSGGTPKAGFVDAPGVPFLKVYNIVDQHVAFDYRPQYVPRSTQDKELRKSRTLPGDVLMNIVGPPLGKVAVVTDAYPEWNINQAITLFRPGPEVSTSWIYTVLCSGRNVAEVIHRTRGSVGQVNISLSQCRNFDIPVPPHHEQAEIIRRVDELFAVADSLQRRYDDAATRVAKLTPSVLSKAFRGELVPQDPKEEPAAKMLKRIRQGRVQDAVASKSRGRKLRARSQDGRRS